MSDPDVAATHDSLSDETQVWNLTNKSIHLPNGQWIARHSTSKIRGWGIWKNNDVVKSWLQTGALTETDPDEPEAPPLARVPSFATFAAPNVFSGIVQPLTEPRSSAQQEQEDV
jgi:hypothetical protein